LVIGAFTVTYLIIPNTTVRWRSALVGGIVSGVLWETVGWGFAAFIVSSGKYTAIYSGFAIVILFLVWLYLNWLVLLLGSSIAFYHQNPGYQVRSATRIRLGFRRQQIMALEIMRLLGAAFQRGENRCTASSLADKFSVPLEVVDEVLAKLQRYGLVVQTCDESPQLMPGRDLQTISVQQVLDAISANSKSGPAVESQVSTSVLKVMHDFDALTDEHFSRVNIRDVLADSELPIQKNTEKD